MNKESVLGQFSCRVIPEDISTSNVSKIDDILAELTQDRFTLEKIKLIWLSKVNDKISENMIKVNRNRNKLKFYINSLQNRNTIKWYASFSFQWAIIKTKFGIKYICSELLLGLSFLGQVCFIQMLGHQLKIFCNQ